MDRSEREHINRCKRLIEEKFQFGNEQGELRQRDLEYLAEIIEEKSGIRLSLSTLKRLWKKDYDKVPHPSTLQALVSVLGYKDWQAFKLSEAEAPLETAPVRKRAVRVSPWLALPVLAVIAVVCWLAFRSEPVREKPLVKGPVTFTGNKTVSQGVPNTVIFNYDLTQVDADSFFFQQSWNPLEKIKLDKANHVYSNIYYLPGFHKAKLIANDSIIKRFKVHITTDGWLPLSRHSFTDANPVYLKRSLRNGALHSNRDELVDAAVDLNKEVVLSYYNIREFSNTQSDNFTIDTRLKCDSSIKTACPGMELVITCEEHIFFVRMMGKGCERDIAVKMGEVFHDGVNHDLSLFGRNLYQWQHLRVSVANKQAVIYLDEQPVYSINFKQDFGKVVGLVFNFTGSGAVDWVRLKKGEELVYAEEFGE
jgi:hypothetical protein